MINQINMFLNENKSLISENNIEIRYFWLANIFDVLRLRKYLNNTRWNLINVHFSYFFHLFVI